MLRPEIIDTLRELRAKAILAGDGAAVEALTAAIRRAVGGPVGRPVEVRFRGCSSAAPGGLAAVMARWGGEAWHPVHVALDDPDRWEVVSFYVGDEAQPVANVRVGDDFRMAEAGWDVTLQLINKGADAAVPAGAVHGRAATMSDRLRAVARDMDREAARLDARADEIDATE